MGARPPENNRAPRPSAVLAGWVGWLMLCTVPEAVATTGQYVQSIPVGVYSDAHWEHAPDATGYAGGHKVLLENYDPAAELWELPVFGGKWSTATETNPGGGTSEYLYSSSSEDKGGYYAYADLKRVELSDTGKAWSIRFSVAGDYTWVGDKSRPEDPVGMKAKYWIYFGNETDHYAFLVEGPGEDAGAADTKLFSASGSPFGSSIGVTGEGGDGFGNEVSNNGLTAISHYNRSTGIYDLEIIYNYGQGIITKEFLEDLDYYYVGTAVSNPSSGGDLFVNDQFDSPRDQSVEFDTLRIEDPQNPLNNPNYLGPNQLGQGPPLIPEPGRYAMVAGLLAVVALFLKRRR